MKAITSVCATTASTPTIANGRVSRHRDGENAEIQMYLSKLKDLVPFMPKNKKLSKLEVILHVIDYICDLQTALESHPAVVNQFDAQAVLNGFQQQQQQQYHHHQNSNHHQQIQSIQATRQPLGVRPSPNTILTMPAHSIINSSELSTSVLTTTDKNTSSDRSSC